MNNTIKCKCGQLRGTVEVAQVKLVLNSPRRKDNGLKFELAYDVRGKFHIDKKQNLLRCCECSEFALTDGDWKAIQEGGEAKKS